MSSNDPTPRFRWLPTPETWKYHLFLGAVAILVLGPLGGVTATFMNFKIGFFVGGQVLAGILGSAVTFGYGAEGKHGANYMQTLAASVASMAAMAVLIQAMYWLGFPVPEAWKLILYYLCIGMFGVGVGMLYTPLLVDKMQLTYPSGLAVANILRALTDKLLLKASILKLALGTGIGAAGAAVANFVPFVGETLQFSGATFGAGMIVGARIGLPAIFVGIIGEVLLPTLRNSGWIGDEDPFRKVGFIIALGAILGAAIVDITLVLRDFGRQVRARKAGGGGPAAVQEDFKKVKSGRLIAWVVFWATAVFLVATFIFGQPPGYVLIALALVFVFMIVNGISQGISDSNPISSAFVLTVLLLALLGLGVATGGLVCASILLISVSIGGDMQQDRSTGWRLGTSRVKQFRYQVVGVTMGAALAVGMASFFMKSNPEILVDQTEPQSVAAYQMAQGVIEVAEMRVAEAAGLDVVPWRAQRASLSDEQRAERDRAVAAAKPQVEKDVAAKALTQDETEEYNDRRASAKQAVKRWQAAMTYKFVGALSVFMDRPTTDNVGDTLSSAEEAILRRAFMRVPEFDANARALVVAAETITAKRLAAAGGMSVEDWEGALKKPDTSQLDKAQRKAARAKFKAAKDARNAEIGLTDERVRAELLSGKASAEEMGIYEAQKAEEAARKQRRQWYPALPPEFASTKGYATFVKALVDDPDSDIPEDLATPSQRKAYAVSLAAADRAHKKGVQTEALLIGISIGLLTEIIRKTLKKSKGYQAWKTGSKPGAVAEFVLDTTILSSPYASSFGGFVELPTSIWFGLGSVYTSASDWAKKKFSRKVEANADLPEDMSTNSLVGGGLIAGESIFFLVFGIISMLSAI